MSDKKIRKAGNSAGISPAKDAQGAPSADRDGQMALAEAIMREDRDVLSALAQMPVAREVMSRRRRALRELAK